MASMEEIRQARIAKLEKLKSAGVNPYPIDSDRDFTLQEVAESFDKISSNDKEITLPGRIMAIRGQGGLSFCDFNDGTGSFQAVLKKEDMKDAFDLFVDTTDVGDMASFTGKLFVTKRGEKSIAVTDWKMLVKSLRPLPEKWHGLQDVEERFRKRFLDTLMNPEIRERFITRSKIISSLREFLDEEGFMEFETPMLQHKAGGASALPFITHHNALDIDLYLRIAPELYLKKLLIGGFPKVYEIGRNFRNEGIDVTHNPEFTMLEFYESWSNAEEQKLLVVKLLKHTLKKATGKTSFTYDGETIDFSKKPKEVSYMDLLKKYAMLADPENAKHEDLVLSAKQLGVNVNPNESREKIMDEIYKKTCRPKIIQPTIITNYPADYLPLAKRNPKNLKLVDAFQVVVAGLEVVKAFSELNDPLDQVERFKKQEDNKKTGEKDAQVMNEDFVEALEYGMPPAGGVGIGIDRLVMLFTDAHNIREVILFPTLRPKKD